MNHQSKTYQLFRYIPVLFTLAALALVGWAVVDRPAQPTPAAAVSLTTTSAVDSPSSAADADVRRKIEDVRVGDLVWAYDEQTGQLEKRPVTALFRSQTDHLRILTLESESGERQRIETTDEHPFWLVGHGWQDAQYLRPGDRLLEPDQSQVTVTSTLREEHPDGLTVYNFEVAGLHDYFVSATATDSLVLSHNMCKKTSGAPNRTVIGKVKDLDNLAPGENTLLKHLPDQGTPRANWRQNSSVLRQEIRKGNPIRDASLNPDGTLKNYPGSFLEAERNLLRNQGWTFDPSTGLWSPAK